MDNFVLIHELFRIILFHSNLYYFLFIANINRYHHEFLFFHFSQYHNIVNCCVCYVCIFLFYAVILIFLFLLHQFYHIFLYFQSYHLFIIVLIYFFFQILLNFSPQNLDHCNKQLYNHYYLFQKLFLFLEQYHFFHC